MPVRSWLPQRASSAGVTVHVVVRVAPFLRELAVVGPVTLALQPSGRPRAALTLLMVPVLQLVTSVVTSNGLPASVAGASGVIRTEAAGASSRLSALMALSAPLALRLTKAGVTPSGATYPLRVRGPRITVPWFTSYQV